MSGAGRPGFTLLEAVVALAIVSITALGALAALAAELRTADRVQWMLPAAALAEDRLARITLLHESELRPLADSLKIGRFGPPFGDYAWSAVVRPNRNESSIYDVEVRVEWESGAYELRSRLYRPRRVEAAQ